MTMAATLKNNVEDTKQAALSPRLKGRGTCEFLVDRLHPLFYQWAISRAAEEEFKL